MRRLLVVLLASIAHGCVTHDGPFARVGDPAMPLHEARAHCKQHNRSTSSEGEVVTDWQAYEVCMADLGWVKQLPSGSGGSAPMGGGGPSY